MSEDRPMTAQPRDSENLTSKGAKGVAIVRDRKGGFEVVNVIGEADLSSAGELFDAIVQASANGTRRVAVDLRLATYIDSTTLSTLIRANNAYAGKFFIVVPKDGIVRRVFAITSLIDVLPTIESLEDGFGRGPRAAS
jgi:anti-anti-sigma factor